MTAIAFDKYDRAFQVARSTHCDLLTALQQIEAQPAPETTAAAQVLIGTLQAALEQAHTLWGAVPAQSAQAGLLCAIDQSLQQLVWKAGHLADERIAPPVREWWDNSEPETYEEYIARTADYPECDDPDGPDESDCQ